MRGGKVGRKRIRGTRHTDESIIFVAKNLARSSSSTAISAHPEACGRQVACGIRQSIPDKSYDNCATLIVTTPSVSDGH
jgi:hypothetical protein